MNTFDIAINLQNSNLLYEINKCNQNYMNLWKQNKNSVFFFCKIHKSNEHTSTNLLDRANENKR